MLIAIIHIVIIVIVTLMITSAGFGKSQHKLAIPSPSAFDLSSYYLTHLLCFFPLLISVLQLFYDSCDFIASTTESSVCGSL